MHPLRMLLTVIGLCCLGGCIQLYVTPMYQVKSPLDPLEVNVYTQVEVPQAPPPQQDIAVNVTTPTPQVPRTQPPNRIGCPAFILPEPAPVPAKPDFVNTEVQSARDVEKILVQHIDRLRGYIQGNKVDLKRRYNEYINHCR